MKGKAKAKFAQASTAERLAEQHGVSPRTIKNDAKFAAEADAEPDILEAVMQGQSAKKAKRQKRKQRQEQRENDARKTIPEEKTWCVVQPKGNQTIGYSMDVIPCAALITDPPYGILTEKWEPGAAGIEDTTRLWASCWNSCKADFFITFFSQRYMWQGKEWFDESLVDYDFQHIKHTRKDSYEYVNYKLVFRSISLP